jgi:ComEC/Rec2-related protein
MRDIPNKELLFGCASLALGESAAFLFWEFCSFWPVAAVLCAVVFFLCYGLAVRWWRCFTLVFLGFALALHSESVRLNDLSKFDDTSAPAGCRLKVERLVSARDGYLSFESSFGKVPLKVVAKGQNLPALECGDVVQCRGWLERREKREKMRRKFWVVGAGSSVKLSENQNRFSFARFAARLRSNFAAMTEIGVDKERHADILAINKAMVFGERSDLSYPTKQIFTAAGTMHLFAISGLHIGIIFCAIVFMAHLLRCPKRIVAFVALPLIWFYVFLIGAPTSALRAATMGSLYILSPVAWRKNDILVAWCRTFLLFHIIWPEKLFEVGSLLSFTVMLAIVLSMKYLDAMSISRKYLVLFVMFGSWAASVPIMAYCFGRVTPGAMIANLILMPLASVAIVLVVAGSFMGLVSIFIASHINNIAVLVSQAMVGVSWAVSKIPYSNFAISRWTHFYTFAWYFVIVMVAILFYIRKKEKLRRI